MAKEQPAKTNKKTNMTASDGGGGMVYITGFIGALIYFIQNADTFWQGVLGVLQAFVWPAYIVFKLLESFYG